VPQDTRVPTDPLINANEFTDVNTEKLLAQIPHYNDIECANDLANTGAEPIPALDLLAHVPNTIVGLPRSSENDFENVPVRMILGALGRILCPVKVSLLHRDGG
jgi:hypothetical protein